MAVRSGVLLSTALSSLPAWRMVDPLPVLARVDDDEADADGESLQSMLADSDSRAGNAEPAMAEPTVVARSRPRRRAERIRCVYLGSAPKRTSPSA
jgi:hypothetical protein